jgi:hypothetical protein
MANADGLNDGLDLVAGALPLAGSLFGPAGSALAGAAGMGIRAFSQWNRSKNAKVPPRPVSITPQGVIENQQNARQIASGSLADASNTLAMQKIGQQAAQGLGAARGSARSSTDVMATLGRINENTNNASNNLGQQKYQQRLGGYNMLSGANQNAANYDDRNFMYNKVEPYNQAVQEQKNLLTASNTNFDRAGQFAMQGVLGQEYINANATNAGYKPSKGIVGDYLANRKAARNAYVAPAPPAPTLNTGKVYSPFAQKPLGGAGGFGMSTSRVSQQGSPYNGVPSAWQQDGPNYPFDPSYGGIIDWQGTSKTNNPFFYKQRPQ